MDALYYELCGCQHVGSCRCACIVLVINRFFYHDKVVVSIQQYHAVVLVILVGIALSTVPAA